MLERVERIEVGDVVGSDVDDAEMRKLTQQRQVGQLQLPQLHFDEGMLQPVARLKEEEEEEGEMMYINKAACRMPIEVITGESKR